MDYFNISTKGKFKLARWISKRPRTLVISELVKNSRDERQLFAMCRYIDRWYDENEGPVKKVTLIISKSSQEASGASVPKVSAPITVQEVKHVVPAKHIHLRQHNFSRHVSSRLNTFITNNPEVCISRMLLETTTEDDLMRAMDDIESKKAVVDPLIKIWTVRVH